MALALGPDQRRTDELLDALTAGDRLGRQRAVAAGAGAWAR